MKSAVIDIGTNTVLLLVLDADVGTEHDIVDVATLTRLGEGMKGRGTLSDDAMDRTLEVLAHYKTVVSWEKDIEEFTIVGTAALREAKNRDVFLKRAKEELDLDIRIITEREEAYYTYLSVKHDRELVADQFMIIDIGGGSSEVIKGTRDRFTGFVSIPSGSVKLTELFIKSDPPDQRDIRSMKRFLRDTIMVPFECGGCRVVATAGTVTTLASILLGLEHFDKKAVHGLKISLAEIKACIKGLISINNEARKRLCGMEPGREDILLQGIILLRELMRSIGTDRIVASTKGVRYGIIYENIFEKKT